MRSANKLQEQLIVSYFNELDIRVGVKRMFGMIKRKCLVLKHNNFNLKQRQELKILQNITYAKLKGIYKRRKLKVKIIKSKNKEHRPLYDYQKLAVFEYLHYDTKTILDSTALPAAIYHKFKLNKDLPIIEWNIIDAKSRFRFLAYSHNRCSAFGLSFLLFTIQFIRASNVISADQKIIIGTDGGMEFFSRSSKKEKQWNELLKIMNASIYAYEPNFDCRKNLIERSHKTDDEEFFIPRGGYINNKYDFLEEANYYFYYYNNLRMHSGICMDDLSPIEKMKQYSIYNADKLLKFPVMILEDCFEDMQKAINLIKVQAWLNDMAKKEKQIAETNFNILAYLKKRLVHIDEYAQNVLTHYVRWGYPHPPSPSPS